MALNSLGKGLCRCVLFVVAAGAALLAFSVQAESNIERPKRGIAADLVDQGDYYQHPNGQTIRFYRKQGVYAIKRKTTSSNVRLKSVSTDARFKAQYGSRVSMVKGHELGTVSVVRINNQVRGKNLQRITPAMLASLDSSIDRLEPVLANAKGSGDILVTSKLIIKLMDSSQDPDQDLADVLDDYNLSVERKLVAPGWMYSVVANRRADISGRFALVRQIMRDPRIDWAQPQFKSRAYRTAFEPNDTLFSEQWHLRNTGKSGSRCDTDCDANNAWDIGNANGVGDVSGSGMVIAVIDDGVQLNHEDLTIWVNPNEIANNNIDDDNNGCVDDINGCDFVDDSLSALLNPLANIAQCKTLITNGGPTSDPSDTGNVKCRCQDNDGTLGKDGDPSPQDDSTCLTFDDEVVVDQDNHGTAVAGIAAAAGNNNQGVAGTAYSATILPIRLVSDFDGDSNSDFCSRVVEAMTYAGLYADVINNSWSMEQGTCPALDTVVGLIVDGTLPNVNTIVPKRAGKGSPVVFASGNDASGWVKVTVPVTAGEHAYEWRFLRSAFPSFYDDFTEDDSAWLDDIRFPDGSLEAFESGLAGFANQCELSQCDGDCDGETLVSCPVWAINADPNYSRSGNSAKIDQLNAYCSYSYLHQIKDGPAGEISFWVWVSTDQQDGSDKFEFLVDGVEILSFGDLPNVIDNAVAYPANLLKVIAVGASNSGDLSGTVTPSLLAEERASYSQYGPTLDVLAPSSDQHLGIVTTDRYGANANGYNASQNIGGETTTGAYTDSFSGTSAAAPVVAGVAAAMIAANNNLTAASIEQTLRATADKIGRRGALAYDQDSNTRSDFYGYGRVNMFAALKSVKGASDADSTNCGTQSFAYSVVNDLLLPGVAPQTTAFCPVQGPLVPQKETCFVVPTANQNSAIFCL